MDLSRVLTAAVLVAGTIGGAYYAAVDREAQGAIVVLLAILYVVGIGQLRRT